jgi:hypothetical protein
MVLDFILDSKGMVLDSVLDSTVDLFLGLGQLMYLNRMASGDGIAIR